MDIKIKVGDADVVVTVANVAEAVAFLTAFAQNQQCLFPSAAMTTTTPPPCESLTTGVTPPPAPTIGNLEARVSLTGNRTFSPPQHPIPETTNPAERIKTALEMVRGTATAKMLATIASSPMGMVDRVLREKAEIGEGSLGPLFSHLSKVCKKAGIQREHILETKERRGQDGNRAIQYFYRLTREARLYIESTPDFDVIPDFPEAEKKAEERPPAEEAYTFGEDIPF